MVPLYRKHVFAQIKPTTISRIDLGLSFTIYKGKLPKRLIDTGGLAKKDRITHRIEVSSSTDSDLKKWLRTAYDLKSGAVPGGVKPNSLSLDPAFKSDDNLLARRSSEKHSPTPAAPHSSASPAK